MNNFTLAALKKLITQSLKEEPTGNDWFDSRYNEQVHYIGHTQPYYNLFYLIAKQLKPSFVVELGSWQATAAAAFAIGSSAAEVVTIDIHKDDKKAQERSIEAAERLANLTYINKWTWNAVEDVKRFNKPIDILFIDAWHNFDMAWREWELYSPLLSDNALVICDDITENAGQFEGMLKFWNDLPGQKFLDNRVHPGVPMGFMKIEKTNVGSNRTTDKPKRKTTTRGTRKSTKKADR